MDNVLKEVQDLVDIFKKDDDDGGLAHPFVNIQKAEVLQAARIFHDSSAVRENPRKCCTVIAQLIHLQDTTSRLSKVEATEVFFGATKLFVSKDASLRRMVYLFIKEVYEACDPNDVIIVTSSLTKDITCDVDLYRANALRVLTRIIDSAMLGAIERYVKQAIVDSSAMVSSSALVSASHLFNASSDCASIVRRWISETQEAVKSRNAMVQFHAMQLLYQIKSHDRLGVSKIVTQFGERNTLKSPLALLLLVRYALKLVHDEISSGRFTNATTLRDISPGCRAAFDFLNTCLRHKSSMVSYEAARAICTLPNVEAQDLNPAVNVLKSFLSSTKPTERFASIRTLASVAKKHPRIVAKCNEELESLVGDANRSIGTLAITTLLKTGSENSIDRLLKQISTFLTDITDEYKITIVRSLQQLCLTYPSKHRVLVGFMSNFLREEGGFEFKKSIVTSVVSLIGAVPETTESSLLQLCEFIEDCEFTSLSTQVLHLLGDLGPKTTNPARYIRFVYNRLILENAMVRAASVSVLTKFASSCPSLRTSIVVMLRRAMLDDDDETRDRAVLAVRMLEDAMKTNPYVAPSEHAEAEEIIASDTLAEDDSAAFLFVQALPMSFDKLERSIHAYMSTPNAMESSEALTLKTLPIVEDIEKDEEEEETTKVVDMNIVDEDMDTAIDELSENKKEKRKAKVRLEPSAIIYAIPELASLGRVFRTTPPVDLTESETEYVVQCIKHVLEEHVVLQFTVQNTIEDQRLENVRVVVDTADSEVFEAMAELASEKISYGSTESCFTVLRRNTDVALTSSTFTCELRFTVVQVESGTGEALGDSFEEEYPLEDLEISTSDFMAKVAVPDFRREWEAMGSDNEVLEKYMLQFKRLEDAVSAVIDFLGMQPCDGTGHVKANASGKPHMLHLSGVFVGNRSVLARAQIAMQKGSSGVVLKIAVRSEDEGVSRMVADCIR